jgi:hypothetical protein
VIQQKVVSVESWGELHILEPALEDMQPLLAASSANPADFGIQLLKLCLHYPDGRKVFGDRVGFAKGRLLMPLVSDCIEVCGLGGEPDANRADGVPVGGEVSNPTERNSAVA